MTKSIDRALHTTEAYALLAKGLKFVSTDRQLSNGTIVLDGTIRKEHVKLAITPSGRVYSNGFKVRHVRGDYPLDMYRIGLKAAGELLAERFA